MMLAALALMSTGEYTYVAKSLAASGAGVLLGFPLGVALRPLVGRLKRQ